MKVATPTYPTVAGSVGKQPKLNIIQKEDGELTKLGAPSPIWVDPKWSRRIPIDGYYCIGVE